MGHKFADAALVEPREEILHGLAQQRLQSAHPVDNATCPGSEAGHEGIEVLEPAHHFAHGDSVRWPRQTHSAAAATKRLDQASGLQALHDLGEVIARNPEPLGNLVNRQMLIGCRKGHEHAQGIIGVKAELHKMRVSDIAFARNAA